ncbi:MAG: hypothetical protein WKF81_09825, partial [Thermomicrobiales bacterium]
MSAISRRLTDPLRRKGAAVDSQAGVETDAPETQQDDLVYASQWKLVWLKFKRHKLALLGMYGIALLYLMMAFNGFLSPFTPDQRAEYTHASPNRIHFFRDGGISPYVNGYTLKADPATMTRTVQQDKSVEFDVKFFARGP